MTLDTRQKTRFISGPQAGLDWVRITGKHGMRTVEEIVRAAAVEAPERTSDRFYRVAHYFRGTGVILKQHNTSSDDSWLVDIPGKACSLFSDKLERVVRDVIEAGRGQFSRVDTAVDYSTENGSLLLDELGDLAAGRQFSRAGGNNKTTEGHQVTLGKRESDTYVRIYDKGAQTGGEWGRWIRFEAEFKKDRARALTRSFLDSDDWTDTAYRVASGSIPEFASVVPEYASEMFTTDSIHPLIAREDSELDRYILYLQTQLSWLVWAAGSMKIDPEKLALQLGVFDAKPSRNHDRHSSRFTALVNRIDDMMSTNGQEEEENTTSGGGLQGSSKREDQTDVHTPDGGQY